MAAGSCTKSHTCSMTWEMWTIHFRSAFHWQHFKSNWLWQLENKLSEKCSTPFLVIAWRSKHATLFPHRKCSVQISKQWNAHINITKSHRITYESGALWFNAERSPNVILCSPLYSGSTKFNLKKNGRIHNKQWCVFYFADYFFSFYLQQ